MTPWNEIRFQFEVLQRPISELALEYDVSQAELEYAADTWTPIDKEELSNIKEQLEPQYANLEQMFVERIRLILQSVKANDPVAVDQLKKLSDCYKTLRYGDNDKNKKGDVKITIINSFQPNGQNKQPESSGVYNVIVPEAQQIEMVGTETEEQ